MLIPPEGLWEPIQAIRRAHDPQISRWMPHVTLLYPFVPEAGFSEAAARLQLVCASQQAGSIELREFRFFVHGAKSATLWLAPEPAGAVQWLQAALLEVFPDCDDASRHAGGFTPHLSVGRFEGRVEAAQAARKLQAGWLPLTWTATSVQLIARSGEEGDPFRVRCEVLLGTTAGRQ